MSCEKEGDRDRYLGTATKDIGTSSTNGEVYQQSEAV